MSFAKSQYDVVLVNPPARVVRERWDIPPFPHIGLAYVGGYLESKGGLTPAIVDGKLGRMTTDEAVEDVVRLRPKIVGITAMTPNIVDASEFCKSLKTRLPGVKIVAGGIHPSFLPKLTLEEFPVFDYVVVGEGEISFLELVKALLDGREKIDAPGVFGREADGRVWGAGRSPVGTTLDEFGEPGWHLFDPAVMKEHCVSLGVMSLRGCPFSCNFCSRPYGQAVRRRTPKLVVDEIERAVDRYGVPHVYFHDETFTVNREHAKEVAREMIARGLPSRVKWAATMHANTADLETLKLLKEAGCMWVQMGVESGNDQIMASMKKGVTRERVLRAAALCKEAGLPYQANFIIGHPHETFWTALQTIRLAVKLNAVESPISVMIPYPGTEIWDMAINDRGGYKNFSYEWDNFGKQCGRAVELEGMPNWLLHTMALGGYVALYVFNFRFRELFKIAWSERRLVVAIFGRIFHDLVTKPRALSSDRVNRIRETKIVSTSRSTAGVRAAP